jgi:hypothetical protein
MQTNLSGNSGSEKQINEINWLSAALRLGKEPKFWLRTAETAAYIRSLADRIYPNPDRRTGFNKINGLYEGKMEAIADLIEPKGVRRTRLNEIKELHAGNMNSAGAR